MGPLLLLLLASAGCCCNLPALASQFSWLLPTAVSCCMLTAQHCLSGRSRPRRSWPFCNTTVGCNFLGRFSHFHCCFHCPWHRMQNSSAASFVNLIRLYMLRACGVLGILGWSLNCSKKLNGVELPSNPARVQTPAILGIDVLCQGRLLLAAAVYSQSVVAYVGR